jgi:hypothetical protein
MSLQTAATNLKAAASAAIGAVQAEATKAEAAKAGFLASVENEIGAGPIGIAAFFRRG